MGSPVIATLSRAAGFCASLLNAREPEHAKKCRQHQPFCTRMPTRLGTEHRRRRIVAALAIAFISLPLQSCGSSSPLAAQTETTSLTVAYVHHWSSLLGSAEKLSKSQSLSRALALGISWSWLEAEAHQLHVRLGRGEVVRQLHLMFGLGAAGIDRPLLPWEAQIEPVLFSSSATTTDRLGLVRAALLRERVEASLATRAERSLSTVPMLHYYRSHMPEFYVTERRDIKAIMNTSRAAVVTAKREMEAGIPFSRLAAQLNQSIEGGLRLGRGLGTQRKRYEKDFFSAPAHVLVGPLKERLYYVFEVIDIKPGHQLPFSSTEKTIKHLLARRAAAMEIVDAERRDRTRTTCDPGFHSPNCGHYATLNS